MREQISKEKIFHRFNVNVMGDGATTLVFVHGYGCNQTMWHQMAGRMGSRFRLVLLDLMGCGLSDTSGYSPEAYDSLDGYAEDVLQVVNEVQNGGATVLIGHSVGAAICLAAGIRAPEGIAALVLVAPSPCFLNDGDYVGGFEPDHIDDIVRFIHEDRQFWAESYATMVVGEDAESKLARDFVQSFCSTHPPAAEQFAHLTFKLDQRAELDQVRLPTLIVQGSDDPLAPVSVGEYMHDAIAGSELAVIRCIGHTPHLSVPESCSQSVLAFLKRMGLMPA